MIGLTRERSLTSYSNHLVRPAQSKTSLSDVPLPVAMLLFTMLLPGELDFYIGTLRLSLQRIVLAAWLPRALSRLLGGKGSSIRGFDYLLIAAFTYYASTLLLKESLDKAIVTGGSMLLEALGGFLIARVYIQNQKQFLATIKLLFLLVMLLGLMAIPESLLLSRVVRNFAASLTGLPPWPPDESRLGLLRAMAVFDHPIHYGAFCAGVFGLVWFSEANLARRITRSALVAGAAFFSLSAAPLQGITFALGGALWERLTRHMPYRVWASIALITCLYAFAALLANRSPLKVFATSMV